MLCISICWEEFSSHEMLWKQATCKNIKVPEKLHFWAKQNSIPCKCQRLYNTSWNIYESDTISTKIWKKANFKCSDLWNIAHRTLQYDFARMLDLIFKNHAKPRSTIFCSNQCPLRNSMTRITSNTDKILRLWFYSSFLWIQSWNCSFLKDTKGYIMLTLPADIFLFTFLFLHF